MFNVSVPVVGNFLMRSVKFISPNSETRIQGDVDELEGCLFVF